MSNIFLSLALLYFKKMKKILFDKIEFTPLNLVQTDDERRFIIPMSQHIERGLVTRVGSTVTSGIKEGDVVEYLLLSKNRVTKDVYYIREGEIIYFYENGEINATNKRSKAGWVAIEPNTVQHDTTESGIVVPSTILGGTTDLEVGTIIAANPNNEELKSNGGTVHYQPKGNHVRSLPDDKSVKFVQEKSIVYLEDGE